MSARPALLPPDLPLAEIFAYGKAHGIMLRISEWEIGKWSANVMEPGKVPMHYEGFSGDSNADTPERALIDALNTMWRFKIKGLEREWRSEGGEAMDRRLHPGRFPPTDDTRRGPQKTAKSLDDLGL